MTERRTPFAVPVLCLLVLGEGTLARPAQSGTAAVAPPQESQTAPSTPPAGRGQRGQGRGAQPGRGGDGGPGATDPANAEADYSPKPPVLPLTPAEEARRFWLPQGFVIEPVLADPDIQDPGQIAFDGNGRMFVAEIRGYMQDASATGQLDPVGRISVHEDRDNDGVYEWHSVFVDKLVFPRFLVPFGANAVLTMETNGDDVWKYTDTDNDGVADKKELFGSGFGRLANVEHQQSGLFWALDNWMYSTINQFRVRWTPTGLLKEPTASNRSQWGATQDNYGKPFFQAGSSGMPGYFQFPIQYGEFNYPQQFEPGLSTIWGAPVLVADMQGGMPAVRMPDGSLKGGTGAAGNDVFRGHRMPDDMAGDYFYGEVVGRVVRRLRPVTVGGLTQLRNVYPQSEFLRSTDPLFRPVDVSTAPDGTLYVTDMYHGIIQEAAWSGPGSYLRARIDQYGLDKVVHKGRIWRIRYAGIARDTDRPRMLTETAAQLVGHLRHPNGWWRDTAQQLLVLRQDRSVVPALTAMVLDRSDPLARIHALWTLEGLGAATADLVRSLFEDSDPRIRVQAIRASETLFKAGNRTFAADYANLAKAAQPDVAVQALLTMNLLKVPGAAEVFRSVKTDNEADGVQLVANTILNPPGAGGGRGTDRGLPPAITPEQTAIVERGKTIYNELCYSCHGTDARGEPIEGSPGRTRAPALAGSTRLLGHRDYVIKTLLSGLNGPLADNASYNEVMVPMGTQPDRWIADVASFVRYSFGNYASFVTPDDVARVRKETASRKTMWTLRELESSLPTQVGAPDTWRISASHNTSTASRAVTLLPWVAGPQQTEGMWLQVELPQPIRLREVQFESSAGDLLAVMGASAEAAAAGFAFGALPDQAKVGYPRAYQVQVSMDGRSWAAPVAAGRGTGAFTTVSFPAVTGRFLRITQTADVPDAPPWTVMRLKLFAAPEAR